jgi:hypothetical protein
MSGSSEERHHEPKHNRRRTAQPRKEDHARSISAPLLEEEEDFIQETPEAALVVAQAYLLTTQLEPEDPREQIHQAAIKSPSYKTQHNSISNISVSIIMNQPFLVQVSTKKHHI